jgi:hypothetical protein
MAKKSNNHYNHNLNQTMAQSQIIRFVLLQDIYKGADLLPILHVQ